MGCHDTDRLGALQPHCGLSGKEMKVCKVLVRNHDLPIESSGEDYRTGGNKVEVVCYDLLQ